MILAPLAPLAVCLGGLVVLFTLLPEKWIPFGAICRSVLGILADVFLLKKLLDRAHRLRAIFWVAVFLFYTIGVFGFFMGVPVFNALLAIPAGFIVGAKLAEQNADPMPGPPGARRTAWFTTGVLALICAASAFWLS